MNDDKTIYNLEIHEVLYAPMQWGVRYDIMRVHGGWIYQPINRDRNGGDSWMQPCFVPLTTEPTN
jgi:hypothetical protein